MAFPVCNKILKLCIADNYFNTVNMKIDEKNKYFGAQLIVIQRHTFT